MRVFFTIALLSVSSACFSQDVTEVLQSLNKLFNNIFTGKKERLSIEFHKRYSIGQPDTSYRLFLQVSTEKYEVTGSTTGVSLFSVGRLFGGGGVSVGIQEQLVKQKGYIYMDLAQFVKFYAGINSVYSYLKTKQVTGNNINTLASREIDELRVGGEWSPGFINTLTFYFQFSEAVFKMEEAEFTEIVKIFRTINETWPKPAKT